MCGGLKLNNDEKAALVAFYGRCRPARRTTGNTVLGKGIMIAIGRNFAIDRASLSPVIRTYVLEELRGKWLVLMFYPRRFHVRVPDRACRTGATCILNSSPRCRPRSGVSTDSRVCA